MGHLPQPECEATSYKAPGEATAATWKGECEQLTLMYGWGVGGGGGNVMLQNQNHVLDVGLYFI